ncbi:MAG: 4-(cytidine 5'-diphospho)-2-C-methyl-D-erythritol kinase [Acidobacteria bacterium]|nr:4-(cytidine 5'-diphospho)-2-C-methyl-D-erythritol kinase [Acidobacteriota bacterium]
MSREPFTLPSFAKINLHLRVLGKRPDGFHELCTVFQTVSLHDRITFEAADEISMTCDDAAIQTGEANLMIRAASRLREFSGTTAGARLHLEKRIPSPGGLAGGSSNAAVTLIGLKRLWELDLADGDLMTIASELGSDVPFFLEGGTMLGTGRGERLETLPDFECDRLVIVTPNVAVSTAAAYDGLRAESLTSQALETKLTVCRSEAENVLSDIEAGANDFENTVLAAFPEISDVRKTLTGLGARKVLMSGSGASVFAIFDNILTRQTALEALSQKADWRSFAAATVSRTKYREALFREPVVVSE